MNRLIAISVQTQNGVVAARQAIGRRIDGHRAAHDRGAAMAEYGLLLGLVALVAIGAIAVFGQELVDVFTEAEAELDGRSDPAADS